MPTKQPQPYHCLTAAGTLVWQGEVLLVRHKKLGIWLSPGGHIEDGELPHQAAEREFFEETGVRVRARAGGGGVLTRGDVVHTCEKLHSVAQGTYHPPSPFLTSLHWICHRNYQNRMKAVVQQSKQTGIDPQWERGCEQHLCFLYLVEPISEPETRPQFTLNDSETTDIAWFTAEQLAKLETYDSIRQELLLAIAATLPVQKSANVGTIPAYAQ